MVCYSAAVDFAAPGPKNGPFDVPQDARCCLVGRHPPKVWFLIVSLCFCLNIKHLFTPRNNTLERFA